MYAENSLVTTRSVALGPQACTMKFAVLVLATILCVDLTGSMVVAEEPENVNPNSTTSRVAVVTGANKGIGFAIAKGLCQQFDGIVYLTARNEARGLLAVEELKKIGLQPKFHQLDINDDSSVETFAKYINDTHGGLDILVNNAGIAFKSNATESPSTQASETVRVNYFGPLRVSNTFFPLLRPHARVVHIASAFGHLSYIPGSEMKARLSSPDLTEDALSQIMRDYVESVKTNTYQSLGWPDSPYTVSKVGVAALARVQQKRFDIDVREDLVVNAAHPGYVSTDLTDHLGTFTPERGAQGPLYLALLPRNTNIKGKYVWHDKTVVDWVNGPLPGAF